MLARLVPSAILGLCFTVAVLAQEEKPSPPPAQPAPAKAPAPQAPAPTQTKPDRSAAQAKPPVLPTGVETPPGFLIGPEDVLQVVFWREKEMSAEVGVRPDGKISLPLVNDVQAAGLTPEQLRANIEKAATKYVEEPTVSVVVKAINSRKVFITGQVAKGGPYSLLAPTTVLQLIAMAGGVSEYARKEDIRIVRTENGKTVSHKFNYQEVLEGKNLAQNIELRPGDTIVVK